MDDWLEIILKALPRIGWVGGILVSVLFVQIHGLVSLGTKCVL